MKERSRYPDIGDIIDRKAKGRIERAQLSFGEKLDILDKLRDDVAPIVQARQTRISSRQQKSRKATRTVAS